MNQQSHNQLVSFIWRIADDCIRDVYVRGKYRDVILPMVVLRRLDTLLEPSKDAVLEEVRYQKEEMPSTMSAPVIKPPAAKAVATAKPKPKPAKNVVVTILPAATGGAIKAAPAITGGAARVAEVIKRLKGLKAAKPSTLKTLQSSLKSWFKPALRSDEVAAVIAALQSSGKISVKGTKVGYTLG